MARFSILVALPGVKGEEIDCDNDSYESPQNDNIDNDDEKCHLLLVCLSKVPGTPGSQSWWDEIWMRGFIVCHSNTVRFFLLIFDKLAIYL